ncbi:hypothetical protein TSOC_004871 [Tetrabaena socialis]|uniref:Rad21/Rec8-like protein N-terminal domain-containing protein n=1 Tax=Tetrabaena socialis TaxID=47790 RepID=A0A2J8A7V8_9CHLO|nr:hypothetical protein TSOC_004871 [Tetrabaena socialis]|eukprot:PNH08570.1 hypothetical protein TSOC_004871 [Tetrabaena socialis]
MFYAAQLVSRDGPLQVLWVAATLDRKLNREAVDATAIPRMVELYLAPDAPAGIFSSGQGQGQGAAGGGARHKGGRGRKSDTDDSAGGESAPLALRLSGQLLLGVCRIYSRKVVYLLQVGGGGSARQERHDRLLLARGGAAAAGNEEEDPILATPFGECGPSSSHRQRPWSTPWQAERGPGARPYSDPHPAAADDDTFSEVPDQFEYDLDEAELGLLRAASQLQPDARPHTAEAGGAGAYATPPPRLGAPAVPLEQPHVQDQAAEGEALPPSGLGGDAAQGEEEEQGGGWGPGSAGPSTSGRGASMGGAAGTGTGGDVDDTTFGSEELADAWHDDGGGLNAECGVEGDASAGPSTAAEAVASLPYDSEGLGSASAGLGSAVDPETLPRTAAAEGKKAAALDTPAVGSDGTEAYGNDAAATLPVAGGAGGDSAAAANDATAAAAAGAEPLRQAPAANSGRPGRVAVAQSVAAAATPGTPASPHPGGSGRKEHGPRGVAVDVEKNGLPRTALATHVMRELIKDRGPLINRTRRDAQHNRCAAASFPFPPSAAAAAHAAGGSCWLAAWGRLGGTGAPPHVASPSRSPPTAGRTAGRGGAQLHLSAGSAALPAAALAPDLQHLFSFLAGPAGRGGGSYQERLRAAEEVAEGRAGKGGKAGAGAAADRAAAAAAGALPPKPGGAKRALSAQPAPSSGAPSGGGGSGNAAAAAPAPSGGASQRARAAADAPPRSRSQQPATAAASGRGRAAASGDDDGVSSADTSGGDGGGGASVASEGAPSADLVAGGGGRGGSPSGGVDHGAEMGGADSLGGGGDLGGQVEEEEAEEERKDEAMAEEELRWDEEMEVEELDSEGAAPTPGGSGHTHPKPGADGFTARTRNVLHQLRAMALLARRVQLSGGGGAARPAAKRQRLLLDGRSAEECGGGSQPLRVTTASELLSAAASAAAKRRSSAPRAPNDLAVASPATAAAVSRIAAARTFYDLLVLTNRGYIALEACGGEEGAEPGGGAGHRGRRSASGVYGGGLGGELAVVARKRLEEEQAL